MCLPSISIVLSICIVDEQMGRPALHGPGPGLARHGPGPDTARPCRAELGFVPSRRPRHGTTGCFSCRAGPKSPAKTTCRASLKACDHKKHIQKQLLLQLQVFNRQIQYTSLSSFKYKSPFIQIHVSVQVFNRQMNTSLRLSSSSTSVQQTRLQETTRNH